MNTRLFMTSLDFNDHPPKSNSHTAVHLYCIEFTPPDPEGGGEEIWAFLSLETGWLERQFLSTD